MTCTQCQNPFEVSEKKQEFFAKIGLGKDYQPQKCSDCLRQQLLAFWPFSNFHIVKCDYSGEKITSVIPPYLGYKIYKREHWVNGDWEAPEMEIDLNKDILSQFHELKRKAPHFHMLGENIENCDFCDDAWYSKNCYLTRSFAYCEDIMYGYRVIKCKDCTDITMSFDSENCYDCTYCFNCHNLKHSLKCRQCHDSMFLYDCRNCHDCFMCFNLRNKKYCILNKQYTKEEYEKKMKEYQFGSSKQLEQLAQEYERILYEKGLFRAVENTKVENCTGNYLEGCKNSTNCFFMQESEDCTDVTRAYGDKDTHDATGALNMELVYLTNQTADCYNLQFSSFSSNCNNSQYLDMCLNSEDCFLCVSLIKKKYCILNKQYTKEEYEEMVPKIIEKMKEQGTYGEFFPYKNAYTPYAESFAAYYYPLSEQEVQEMNALKKQDDPIQKEDMKAEELPDNIQDVKPEEFMNKKIRCAESGLLYSFIPKELEFYKKNNIPLPRVHSYTRNKKRFDLLYSGFKKREVNCAICNNPTVTYFPENFPGRIACEECYLKEVY